MQPNQSWLLKDTDPNLRKLAVELILPISKNDQELIERMVSYIDACYHKKNKEYGIRTGIALAGPQVGLLKKVIYLHCDFNKQEYKYLIANPQIIAESMVCAYIGEGEGCLSVDQDHQGVVKRKNKIIIKAYDLFNQKNITINAEGVLAICLQHEIDHLNGILYYDRINKNEPLTIQSD
jgi:peptide deformylase